ncbi:hypothetical protein ACI2VP_25310 [Ralstonia nicotianae]|uniref:hypothetical protein n=1 Tax=Ralstonia pseudosolanacearum TaxID=1310165 RepID=UPI00200340B7|nr:hypothetical protein [Ralstonia pseudosolanacearum]
MMLERIPPNFIQYAADILGDTNVGLSGANIVRETAAYAVKYDVNIPHPTYPFEAGNKRTALYANLMAFSPQQQYQIIKKLCDHKSFPLKSNSKRKELKIRLVSGYSHLDPRDLPSEVNETLIEETKHWLDDYPEALSLYSQALEKYGHGAFQRNLLDDLRLSLEKLLRAIFNNSKPIEKQISSIGEHIKHSGGSPELSNMFLKLLDYYAKYHNSYVKHDDAVIEEEIEFIFEITSSFMKHLVRLSGKNS